MERFNSQRTVVITGSSSGIGLAIIGRVLSDGWAVIGIDISPRKVKHPAFTAIHSEQVPYFPPLGRFIKPEEIADTVSFLLSPTFAAITGQELMICGGASLAS